MFNVQIQSGILIILNNLNCVCLRIIYLIHFSCNCSQGWSEPSTDTRQWKKITGIYIKKAHGAEI